MNPGVVPMISPDGSTGDVPFERVNDATAAGFKPAVVMTSPDGQMGYVPRERAADALKAGFKVGQPETKFEKDRNPANHQGALSSVASEVGSFLKAAPGMITGAMEGPTGVARTAVETGAKIAADDTARKLEGRSGAYRAVAAVGTPLGVNASKMEDQAEVGNTRGIVGTAVGDAAPVAAGEAVKRFGPAVVDAAKNVTPPLKGALASRMAEVPAGEQFSRQQVLDAAKAKGVNLDIAQATDSKVAQSVKKANQYSLAGEGQYEANATKNLDALDQWANSEAAKYSPDAAPRAAVGPQMQQALKSHLEVRQNAANQLFADVEKSAGTQKIDLSGSVQEAAKNIIDQNKAYYVKNQSLLPSRAWGIVNDLASQKVATITDLQRLRSDLMSEYRSPDIAGSRAEGWLKQLAGATDNAMTESGRGLTGENLAKWRKANSVWESIKSTYDNPQSPYYHAIRSSTPSQVPAMLSRSPELVQSVRATLGSIEGPFQRQFVENLLNGKDGATMDLRGLNSRVSRVPQDLLESMLGKEGASNLRMLAKVAAKVTADSNPSGTAKSVVKAGEIANLATNPVSGVAELGGQYGLSRAMNSAKVRDYLTTPKR